MSMKDEHQDTAIVPIRMEILTIIEDELKMGPGGSQSVGEWLDNVIQHNIEQGERIGKVTIDLTEHSEKYISHTRPPAHTRPKAKSKI